MEICICKRCGQDFKVDDEQLKKIEQRGWELPYKCPSCRKEYQEMRIAKDELGLEDKIKTCMDCGDEFNLSWENQLKCKMNGWEETKRCYSCKQKIRNK